MQRSPVQRTDPASNISVSGLYVNEQVDENLLLNVSISNDSQLNSSLVCKSKTYNRSACEPNNLKCSYSGDQQKSKCNFGYTTTAKNSPQMKSPKLKIPTTISSSDISGTTPAADILREESNSPCNICIQTISESRNSCSSCGNVCHDRCTGSIDVEICVSCGANAAQAKAISELGQQNVTTNGHESRHESAAWLTADSSKKVKVTGKYSDDLTSIVSNPYTEKILLMAKLSTLWHPCS